MSSDSVKARLEAAEFFPVLLRTERGPRSTSIINGSRLAEVFHYAPRDLAAALKVIEAAKRLRETPLMVNYEPSDEYLAAEQQLAKAVDAFEALP